MKKGILAGMAALTLLLCSNESMMVVQATESAEIVVQEDVEGAVTEVEADGAAEAVVDFVTEADVAAEAAADVASEEWTQESTEYVLNPIYEQDFTTEDLKVYIANQGEQTDTAMKFNANVYETDTIAEAANAIKGEMKARSTACTIITSKSNGYRDIFNQALVDSIATAPNEGDYLRANWYGYEVTAYKSSTRAKYVFTLMYVDDAEKEQAVTEKIPTVLESLNLTGKSDFRKVMLIQEYICKNVTYTKDEDSSLVYYSTYGALINGEAVCQGYASLFYRLCREAGISARFITGLVDGDAFAWNIVRLGNYYYNLDVALADSDNSYKTVYFDYFLRSDENFEGHTRQTDKRDGMDYTSEEFQTAYPIGPKNYTAMAELSEENYADTFVSLEGYYINTEPAGKPKMLIFMDVSDETDCAETIHAISQSSYVTEQQIDAVAIDVGKNLSSKVSMFRYNYGSKKMIFCYNEEDYFSQNAANSYRVNFGMVMKYPMIFYIGTDNKVRATTYGVQTTSEVDEILAKIMAEDAANTYSITAGTDVGGTITPNGVTNVMAGSSITYTITPASGYGISDVKVDGVSVGARTTYTFDNISADHTITASFAQISSDHPFADVRDDAYYTKPVNWAVKNGITSGTSATTFEPNAECTRGQIVTFLWRTAGCPNPSSTKNPFADVKSNAYYYKAVLWAVEKGITTGTSGTTFSPDESCTRGQAVTFLYRYASQPSVGSTANPFADVNSGAYYYNPVLWAVDAGVTSGTSETTFEPDKSCTRGQIVTFLYRHEN